jgi:hypothetical protein
VHLRLGSEAVAGGVTAVLLACSLVACGREGRAVTVSWNITPTPPLVGADTLVRLRLLDAEGHPITLAKLQLEAHMSHPGMTPVTAGVIEQSAGAYEARVRLPMAGDWRFVVAGALADGSRITHDTPVPGVRAAATPGGG